MNRQIKIIYLFIFIWFFGCAERKIDSNTNSTLDEEKLKTLSDSLIVTVFSVETDSSLQIKKAFGSFTADNKKEVLVGVPYLFVGKSSFLNLFLLEEKNGKWNYTGWVTTELTQFEPIDINDDGVLEILTKQSAFVSGGTALEHILIFSLRNRRIDTLYTAYSEDSYSAGPGREAAIGDTVIKLTTIEFFDTNNGKQLREKKEISTIKKRITLDSAELATVVSERIIDLKNKNNSR